MTYDQRAIRVVSGVLRHPRHPDLVLMGLRLADGFRPNLWELPGGKVDLGEGPRRALEREFSEELDVSVQARDLLATGVVHADLLVLISAYELLLDPDLAIDIHGLRDFSCMSMAAHQELRWVSLEFAVERMPCSPGFYVHYPFLEHWMTDRISGVR